MAKAKSKPSDEITKPQLFNEEEPVEANHAKEQIEIEQREHKAEPDPLKKRTRSKKIVNPSVPVEAPGSQDSGQPPTSIVSLPHEISPTAQLPPDPKQMEEKEAQLKEKYKKQQEDRLAALKRVRANK